MKAGGVLAVFAHPDDESLLAGGTLAACAEAGEHVEVLCMTRGELGPGAADALFGARREAELRQACSVLGVTRVTCLDHPDGALSWIDGEAAVSDLATRMRASGSRVVITFGSEGLYWHGDHVAVHDLVGAAYDRALEGGEASLYAATWPQGLATELAENMRARGLPAQMWGLAPEAFGVAPETITTVVDARPLVETKLRALRAHRSQVAPGHLLYEIPGDLAAELLGREYFVLLKGDDDPLGRLRPGLIEEPV